ncbi:unnamed protein product, partial [marine sediment metagenome]
KRTENQIDGFIDLRGEKWFLKDSPNGGSVGEKLIIRPIQNIGEINKLAEVFGAVHLSDSAAKDAEYIKWTRLAIERKTGRIIGGFQWIPSKSEKWGGYAVHPEYQSKGIGTALFKEFLKMVEAVGIEGFEFLAVEASEGFWRKMGAVVIGTEGARFRMKYSLKDKRDKSTPYPRIVPEKAHQKALDELGKGDLIKINAALSRTTYLKDTLAVKTFWQENRGWLKERLEQLTQITNHAPPKVTWIITTDPAKLGEDPKTDLPYVASCDIDSKIVYIHPYF